MPHDDYPSDYSRNYCSTCYPKGLTTCACNKTEEVKFELFAFWKYDLFPYLIGGQITKLLSNGRVRTKEFGGYSFTPVKMLSVEEGAKLRSKLNDLKLARDKAIKEIELEYQQELNNLLSTYSFPDHLKR